LTVGGVKKLTSKTKYYHKSLGLEYEINKQGLLFKDEVFYSNKEINILRKIKNFDHKLIHIAKKIFTASVVELDEV